LGLPMVIAILLFLTYHFIGVAAENAAKKGAINPVLGAWHSTLIMMPFGIYLTKRATADRGLMNISNKLAPLLKFFKRKKEEEETVEEEDQSLTELFQASQDFVVDTQSEAFEKLHPLPNHQLEDVVQNFEQYEYPEEFRFTAIKILEKRGVGLDDLKQKAKLVNNRYQQCKLFIERFKRSTLYGSISWFLTLVGLILGGVLKDEKAQIIILGVLVILLIVLYYNLIRSLAQHRKIYDLAQRKAPNNAFVLLLVGIPFFIAYHWMTLKDLKEVSKQIR